MEKELGQQWQTNSQLDLKKEIKAGQRRLYRPVIALEIIYKTFQRTRQNKYVAKNLFEPHYGLFQVRTRII